MLINFIKAYLIKTKNLSILMAAFFIASAFLGYVLARNYPEKTNEIILEGLKDMFEPAKNYTSFQLFAFIFFKNLIVAVAGVLSGIIFGIIPILIIFINGMILGVISHVVLRQYDALFFLAGIAPHGILEIPAIIFSAVGGLWFWQAFYRRALYDEKILGGEFISIMKFLIFAIVPMLAVAAIIEIFITPRLLDLTALSILVFPVPRIL